MIRLATVLDVPEIINLAKLYVEGEVKEVGHHSTVWDAGMMAANLINSILNVDGFLMVSIVDGCVVGFFWATAHFLAPWSPTLVASDLLFYMKPEHRGAYATISLINAYKAWAEDIGCKEIRISTASGVNTVRTVKLYERLGFSRFALTYNHKVKENDNGWIQEDL